MSLYNETNILFHNLEYCIFKNLLNIYEKILQFYKFRM